MNALIIEDEKKAAIHLDHQLGLTGEDITIAACLSSVEDSIDWLSKNRVDLIFMDIQLGDGLSFEIFDHVQVTAPVIFTTSHNEFAIKAFEANGIAYLVKPIKVANLSLALSKFKKLFNEPKTINDQIVALHQQYIKRFLVQSGDTLLPLMSDDIAYFRVHTGRYLLVTDKYKHQYLIDNKLEILELRLHPEKFFRVNRQFIVNIDSISQIRLIDNGKLKVIVNPESKEEIIVSKERAAQFKSWLEK